MKKKNEKKKARNSKQINNNETIQTKKLLHSLFTLLDL